MRGEYRTHFILFLITVLVAGSIGFVFGTQSCSAQTERVTATQCSAHTLSIPTHFRSVDQRAAVASKTIGLLAVVLLVFASGVAQDRKKSSADARIRTLQFTRHLPRSWPHLPLGYPAHLICSSQP
jgi:hypothetical protein